MKLHDNTIAHIAKIIQMAIITGTDIVDHLRMMELELSENDILVLTQEYKSRQDNSVEEMIKKVSN
tara:strand:+ start:1039 stop:1236 length:198 start_codon:yes stop_codon:yes gene_type:complete